MQDVFRTFFILFLRDLKGFNGFYRVKDPLKEIKDQKYVLFLMDVF